MGRSWPVIWILCRGLRRRWFQRSVRRRMRTVSDIYTPDLKLLWAALVFVTFPSWKRNERDRAASCGTNLRKICRLLGPHQCERLIFWTWNVPAYGDIIFFLTCFAPVLVCSICTLYKHHYKKRCICLADAAAFEAATYAHRYWASK